VFPGECLGLVGENGAGKSTLMSILFGFLTADGGSIRIGGQARAIGKPADAILAGIGMVHQHFMLVDQLSVIENVMLGAEGGAWLGRGERAMRAAMAGLARDYGLDVDPDARVGDLPVGLRQRVEIIKLLVRGADILVLDEPTAVLTPAEARGLFALTARLRGEGRTVLLVTHKLNEIMAATDRVSVMRRGEMVATLDTATTSAANLAELMVGRKLARAIAKKPRAPGPTLLEAEDLAVRDPSGALRLDGVSLQLRSGEIVGVAGVSGNGQPELLEALAGMRRIDSGRVRIGGKPIAPVALNPRSMRRLGLLHVPEDRLGAGLVPAFPAHESAMLGYEHEERYGAPLLSPAASVADVEARMTAYDVRPREPRLRTSLFSGGNQQKIVLAREVERAPRILLVGQPTRGVDVGAIEFIHRRLLALREAGVAILLVSVELDELTALADRILVMCAGRIIGERRPEETDERELGLLVAGVTGLAA